MQSRPRAAVDDRIGNVNVDAIGARIAVDRIQPRLEDREVVAIAEVGSDSGAALNVQPVIAGAQLEVGRTGRFHGVGVSTACERWHSLPSEADFHPQAQRSATSAGADCGSRRQRPRIRLGLTADFSLMDC